MKIKYLIDENLSPLYKEGLLRHLPNLTVITIGDPNAPPKSTLDPEILIWCQKNDFIIVTNNRTSMPVHLAEHLKQYDYCCGIFVLRKKFTIGEIINNLVLIAQTSDAERYRNFISYIPLK